MERSLSEIHLDEDDSPYAKEHPSSHRCAGCDEEYEKPILATVTSGGRVQTYYACPRCLSKVGAVKQQQEEAREVSASPEIVRKAAAKSEEGVKCSHFMGYLKKRSKDAAYPEECLTCDKMIECMLH
jgi:DNA-directed RNA polymerase subunit RPC12/RpoP